MYYIQELISLLGNADFSKEEVNILNKFTDERVGFKTINGYDYSNNPLLKSSFRKLKENGLFNKYRELIIKHTGDSMDEFTKHMDIELWNDY